MKSNPPGYVPSIGQGIVAKENQEGVEGGKQWLKSEKLHKYWPMFSHWSYDDLMSITEENIDLMISKTGATGVTVGARKKLLRCISSLREREGILRDLPEHVLSKKVTTAYALRYLERVLQTPLPTGPIESLPAVVIYAVIGVYQVLLGSTSEWEKHKIESILAKIEASPTLQSTASKLLLSIRLEGLCSFCGCEEKDSKKDNAKENVEVEDPKRGRKRMLTEDSGFEDYDWYTAVSEKENIWPVEENTVMFQIWSKSLITEELKDGENLGDSSKRFGNDLQSNFITSNIQPKSLLTEELPRIPTFSPQNKPVILDTSLSRSGYHGKCLDDIPVRCGCFLQSPWNTTNITPISQPIITQTPTKQTSQDSPSWKSNYLAPYSNGKSYFQNIYKWAGNDFSSNSSNESRNENKLFSSLHKLFNHPLNLPSQRNYSPSGNFASNLLTPTLLHNTKYNKFDKMLNYYKGTNLYIKPSSTVDWRNKSCQDEINSALLEYLRTSNSGTMNHHMSQSNTRRLKEEYNNCKSASDHQADLMKSVFNFVFDGTYNQ